MKKSQFYENFEKVAILAIILIIMVTVFTTVKDSLEAKSKKDICRASVYAHAKARFEGTSTSEIKCETEQLHITDNSKAFPNIANSLYDCWDMMGQGELDLFGKNDIHCHICNIIDFTQKGEKLSGLGDYLKQTKVPGKKFTYEMYLMGITSEPDFDKYVPSTAPALPIDTNERYASVFVYIRGQEKIKEFWEKLYSATPGAAAFTIGMGAIILIKAGFVKLGLISGPIGWGTLAATGLVYGIYKAAQPSKLDADEVQRVSFIVLKKYKPGELDFCKYLPVGRLGDVK